MPNQLYNDLNKNGSQNQNMDGAFEQFMNRMRGQNPNQIINQMVSQGQLSQSQLNMAQQKAQQIGRFFDKFRPKFHF